MFLVAYALMACVMAAFSGRRLAMVGALAYTIVVSAWWFGTGGDAS